MGSQKNVKKSPSLHVPSGYPFGGKGLEKLYISKALQRVFYYKKLSTWPRFCEGLLSPAKKRNFEMGLSSFPNTVSEGVLPILIVNTALSFAIIKDILRSILQIKRSSLQKKSGRAYPSRDSNLIMNLQAMKTMMAMLSVQFVCPSLKRGMRLGSCPAATFSTDSALTSGWTISRSPALCADHVS
ncbi:hypothetical protein SUGI_0093930 [Cryptomeria japonica]|nr:hypothetical protein SUGI_0093930 [Cryptomeria japonica]